MPDRPTPILVEQVLRALPADLDWWLKDAPLTCREGARFVDELYRERRISSVEWRVLRDAIWPRHQLTGEALLQMPAQPNPSSAQRGE